MQSSKSMNVQVIMSSEPVDVSVGIKRNKYGSSLIYPCGIDSWVGNGVKSEDKLSVAKHHVECCSACKVILGKSEAIVMNQDQVAACFSCGIDGKRSGKNNLRAQGGILMHYGTIEAIRTHENVVISNTQCWSMGFAKCPHVPKVSCRLPLSTLSGIFRNDKLREMIIIDQKNSDVLFKIPVRVTETVWNSTTSENEEKTYTQWQYILYGIDGEPFLARLKVKENEEPKTIKEAYESMVPMSVKGALRMKAKVQRHGDLYFIPLPRKPLDVDRANTDTWRKKHKNEFYYRFLSHAKISNIEVQRYVHEHSLPVNYSTHETEIVIHKKLYRPVIYVQNRKNELEATNHVAEERAEIIMNNGDKDITVVRGTVRHLNGQHASLDLGRTWHAVVQNVTEETWNVPRRGETVRGD